MSIQQKRREKTNKTKARTISAVIHAIFLIFFLIPFMSMSITDSELARKNQRKQIVINFSKPEIVKFEEARAELLEAPPLADNPVTNEAPASAPPTEAAPTPAEAASTPTPAEVSPVQARPAVTQPTPSTAWPTFKEMFSKPFAASKPTEQNLPEEDTGEEELTYSETTDEKGGTGNDPSSDNKAGRGEGEEPGGSTSNPGQGTSGTSSTPGAAAVAGANYNFNDFGRNKIYEPPFSQKAKIMVATGKIAVVICVNQDGRVVYSKSLKEESTVRRSEILAETERLLKRYRFDRDYSAPEKQCGKYFITIAPMESR